MTDSTDSTETAETINIWQFIKQLDPDVLGKFEPLSRLMFINVGCS
jgi:hypothetical protein